MIALEGDTYDAVAQHQMTRGTRRFAALGTTTGEQPWANQDVAREGHAETAASPVPPSANALGRISEADFGKQSFALPGRRERRAQKPAGDRPYSSAPQRVVRRSAMSRESRQTILLVDDNPQICSFIRPALEDGGVPLHRSRQW